MKMNFSSILQLDPGQIKAAKTLRNKSIDDALLLSSGSSREDMDYHVLWSENTYEVGVGKPGKETVRKIPNPHDMWPFIRKNGAFEEKSATFGDIFHELEHMSHKSPHSLELLGCLFARSAYMLDHEMKDGKVVYNPPKEILEEITKDIPEMFKVPLAVFLQYIDMIALNEDAKYQRNLNSKGKKYGTSAGRPNNLLTCAHLISVLLERSSIVDFAYGFAQQRGVSAIKIKQLPGSFPYLAVGQGEAKAISELIEK